MIPLAAYQGVALVLFGVGLAGLLLRRNFFFSLVSLEVMLNAAGFFVAATACFKEISAGEVVALFILLVAAAEAAVGLAFLIQAARVRGTTDLDTMTDLKG